MSETMNVVSRAHVKSGAAMTGAHRRFGWRRCGTNVIALIFCVVWIFPVYWMTVTAFKPRNEIMTTTPAFIPKHWSLVNFYSAIMQTSFLQNLENSVIVTFSAIIISVFLAFLACAALTLYRFRGRRVIMVLILAMQMLPGTALLIPQFIVFNQMGLLNRYIGLILAYIAMVLPFSIWNMRGFFLAIPVDIFESARVEGASEWQILRKITFPLVAPGVVSTSVFAFITAWNDYLTAYTFMRDQAKYTLPVWLSSFTTPAGTDFGGQMAASVLFSLPVVVFFMIVQRNIAKGSTAGAVK
ncbi:N,N'-diacetylchitobiose transport system permease protein [Bifidobacterium bohemicum]|uniref:ABC transporter, permease protein n=2 Tax=Bifidobacterium bohemicum TaxID=638617 RepID=A0A086ZKA8_9BIFI|nr:carbohydrate ABC transporter permease [Bifidobacterium bohemicum]KFI46958.1 ABC transporter, permease protein [Bifidobacterium bohemicum DSM 22767]SCB86193.1 N,N'-diacetylchitobiose transport system permease protein [Bifidobacterium bohemicum]